MSSTLGLTSTSDTSQLCLAATHSLGKKRKAKGTSREKIRNWKWNYYYNSQWNVSWSTLISLHHLAFVITSHSACYNFFKDIYIGYAGCFNMVFYIKKLKSINWKTYASKIKIFYNIKWDSHPIVFTKLIYLNK